TIWIFFTLCFMLFLLLLLYLLFLPALPTVPALPRSPGWRRACLAHMPPAPSPGNLRAWFPAAASPAARAWLPAAAGGWRRHAAPSRRRCRAGAKWSTPPAAPGRWPHRPPPVPPP